MKYFLEKGTTISRYEHVSVDNLKDRQYSPSQHESCIVEHNCMYTDKDIVVEYDYCIFFLLPTEAFPWTIIGVQRASLKIL